MATSTVGVSVTERERLLLLALAEGATATGIAGREGLPVAVVRRELRTLRNRLGAGNSVNAVVIALRHGII